MAKHELQAQTQLRVSGSRLPAADLIAVVAQAAETVKMPAMKFDNKLQLTRRDTSRAEFAITVFPRKSPLATFAAVAADRADGGSVIVGGLDGYKVKQSVVLGVIPAGPKSIPAFPVYKRFLEHLEEVVRSKDSAAKVTRSA